MARWITEERVTELAKMGRLRDASGKIDTSGMRNCEVVSSLSPNVSKFRNVKTDGYASKKEAARASQLRLMQEAGQIRNLREQLEYELIPRQEGERACFYRADFVYDEFGADGWRQVVEDTKGMRTADYVIKRKLMLHVHGIRIRET